MDFQGRYTQLNAAQKRAVDTIDGPVMVIAGPGTGKTELLSMRVANILRLTDTAPENILCLTFTESGVTAMRERLIGIIGQAAYKVAIHTFHSFGTDVINQNREYFYNGASFGLADDIVTYQILRKIFESLSLNDPLASKMNDEFSFQSDAQQAIGELKKAGLTSAELLAILDANDVTLDQAERLLLPTLDATVAIKMVEPLQHALDQLTTIADHSAHYGVPALADVIIDSLRTALDEAVEMKKATPLSLWKKRFLERNKDKRLTFKARKQQHKLRSLAVMYDQYLSDMQAASLYDYDDIILQVVHAMEIHSDLRYNLQEKYQYLLVDEFQDTNLSQMRILHNLTDNPVNEGRPNIFIVGDDDQAIYSFQGADVSNILNFRTAYPAAQNIVLTDNYRSAAEVLVSSRALIVQAHERLEQSLDGLSKELTAQTKAAGTIALIETASSGDERRWLVDTIQRDIKAGTRPHDIAVLARGHKDILALLPYFAHAGVTVTYERNDDALALAPIVQLETLGRVLLLLSHSQHDRANRLLAEMLSHPAWGFSSQDVWKLSTQAYDKRQRWLDTMEAIPAFTTLRSWLIDLVADAPHTPLEHMLDRMIGRAPSPTDETMTSPLYDYFFCTVALASDPASYLVFLDALRTLRSKLLEFHPDRPATLASFIDFIELHRKLKRRISISQTIGDNQNVHLITAHSSKGLEFPSVYIVNATEKMWGKASGRSALIGYPENLAIQQAGNNADERLRLFYVAMTRAKHHLTISYSLTDDSGKATLPANFLIGGNWAATTIPAHDTIAGLTTNAELAWYQPLTEPSKDLKALLLPRIESYRLSATHLNAFLNVPDGGPQLFLVDYLLHFPQAESIHAAYGSAIHKTLQQAHTDFITNGALRPVEDIIKTYETAMSLSRAEPDLLEKYLQKGSDELTAYLTNRAASFQANQKAELDFGRQEAIVGEAKLNGKLDLVTIDAVAKTIVVSDYKTGKPSRDWKGSSEYDKIKLHKYRQQLLFYKLLVENSRDFGSYTVTAGNLEFIEPDASGNNTPLELQPTADEIERTKALIAAVWRHIQAVDLPDTSAYSPDLKGMLAFEQDLIDNKI